MKHKRSLFPALLVCVLVAAVATGAFAAGTKESSGPA